MSYYMKYINVWWIVQFLTLALLGCRHVGELVAGVFFLVCIVGCIWGNAKVKLLSAMGLFMLSGGLVVISLAFIPFADSPLYGSLMLALAIIDLIVSFVQMKENYMRLN